MFVSSVRTAFVYIRVLYTLKIENGCHWQKASIISQINENLLDFCHFSYKKLVKLTSNSTWNFEISHLSVRSPNVIIPMILSEQYTENGCHWQKASIISQINENVLDFCHFNYKKLVKLTSKSTWNFEISHLSVRSPNVIIQMILSEQYTLLILVSRHFIIEYWQHESCKFWMYS